MEISSAPPLPEGKEILDSHVSSMIGLSRDFTSILNIHCPGNVGMAITSKMLGMDVECIEGDVKDTLGEIANMVADGVKEAFAAENIIWSWQFQLQFRENPTRFLPRATVTGSSFHLMLSQGVFSWRFNILSASPVYRVNPSERAP
ncbi:chemotaxis protein CheX [Malonomonas rubra]|uniref:chemotaxis protein CheX n=1 Tax=Malonomonas rubra TaxID=57040 RepID=UPI0026ED2CA0|nr:chemotaxis protein CheX [Malonomonas rubra]